MEEIKIEAIEEVAKEAELATDTVEEALEVKESVESVVAEPLSKEEIKKKRKKS